MASVRFEDFGGIAPGVSPARLPANAALRAHNCRLKSGRLEPLREPSADTRRVNFEGGLNAIADAGSLYLWNKSGGAEPEWIAWKGRVSVAPSNLAVDANNRLFVTGETGYTQTDTDGVVHENAPVIFLTRPVGYTKYPIIKPKLPKPEATLTAEPSDPNTLRYTYFFQTWVDQYGYESPASVPSDEIAYNDGQQVRINEFLITDAYASAMKRRIYKVITGTETEAIQFITEQDRVGSRFLEAYFIVKDEDAGEIITQIEAPPWTLGDILWMPGGFYAGVDRSTNRTVCFSDVNLPYSWPLAYQYTVKDDIVGIALIGNTLAVLTTGSPWIVSGTAPEAMSVTSLSSPYACVSKESICTLGNTVFYASHTGIYGITEGSSAVQPLTNTWWTAEAWQALRPETCRMVAHDQALFLWFTTTGGTTQGYIVDFNVDSTIKAVTTHDEPAGCLFEDVANGTLCYVRRGVAAQENRERRTENGTPLRGDGQASVTRKGA